MRVAAQTGLAKHPSADLVKVFCGILCFTPAPEA